MAQRQQTDTAKNPASVDTNFLNALQWRLIGPFRGGRCVAVAGDPVNPLVFYHGATAGGVWKTYDGGTYWENVSDGFFNTSAVGAIAVSDSDPNVIYAGTETDFPLAVRAAASDLRSRINDALTSYPGH